MGRRKTATQLFKSIIRMSEHGNKYYCVRDALGFFGPQTVASLRKRIREGSNCILDNTEICRVIKELKEKGWVKELAKKRGAVFGLTFKGLIDYLRNDGPELDTRKATHLVNLFENPLGGTPLKRSAKHRQMDATRDYLEKLFPFLPAWKSIVKSIGDEEKCLKILQTTINDFNTEQTEPINAVISPLEFEVTIFHQAPVDNNLLDKPCVEPLFSQYLTIDVAKELREPYLAYLLQQDLNRIKDMSKKEFGEVFPKLGYLRDLARLEKTMLSPTLIKEYVAKFLSKYPSVEFYFVGMFVYNLLWKKSALDEHPLD